MMLANLGFAATDVITDGLIVEHSRGFSSHIYQSIAWGTRSVGAIVSGVAGGWLAAHWEAKNVFLLTMFLPVLVMVLAFRIKDVKQERGPFKSWIEPFKRCLKLLLIHNLRWFGVLLIITTVSSMFGVPFFFYMKETLNFSETFLGILMSVGWTGAVIGSLLYARWLSKVSPKVILRWAIIINTINILGVMLIKNQTTALILTFLGGFMGCLTILPIMSVSAMLTHDSGVEGTLFAVLMSIFNLGQISFGFLGGQVYPLTGITPLIILSGIVSLSGLWVVHQLHFENHPTASAEKLSWSKSE